MQQSPQTNSTIRILIVEDFHAETETLLRELNDAELVHEFLIVHSEQEYKKALSSFRPTIILSPYSLPKTNAVKLLGIARNTGENAPFILLAYDLSEDIAIDLLGEGMEDYILRSTIKRLPVAIKRALQRHRIQKELRRNEASLNIAQKLANIGGWELDIQTQNINWSDEMFAIHGLSKQAVNLDLFYSVIHPDDIEKVKTASEKAFKGNSDQLEYRIIRANDKVERTVHCSKVELVGSKLVGTVQDITDRKAREERMETLSLVASETINGVVIQDPDGVALWANKGFAKITGYAPKDVIGKKPWELVSGTNTNQKLIEIAYTKMQLGRPFSSDNQLQHKDGHTVWVNTSVTPIFDEDGNVKSFISIGTDISKQKELETLQREMVTRLEARVKTRTSELEEINQELRKEVWENQRISDELYHSNLDLKDSIQYAKRIQESILPKLDSIHESFSDLFILFLPRDVVSGDFYWHYKRDNLSFFAAIDCTGHGVPGALMSMIANELMNQVIIQKKLTDPGEILTRLNKLMVRTLQQKNELLMMQDGMDIGLCVINHKANTLQYSGAFSSIYVSNQAGFSQINGSRHSIGGHLEDVEKEFETIELPIEKGDIIYLATDGYVDQFGGPKGKKLMKKRFEEILRKTSQLPINQQKDHLNKILDDWKGELNQVDDILVAGLKY